MKTRAFFIRVAICFTLSLIPATEMENQIYSARLRFRGAHSAPARALIITATERKAGSIEADLLARGADLILKTTEYNPNDLLPDPDGVVRHAVQIPEGPPTLTHAAFEGMHLRLAKPERAQRPHLINFLGPAGTFVPCAYPKLAGCEDLHGKIVLLEDRQEKMLTPFGPMTRAEVLANDLYTVVDHHPIYEVPFVASMLIALALILIGALYIIYYPVVISALAVTGTGIAVVIIFYQILFDLFGVYIPAANAVLALFITYLTFTGYRLALQENLQWRSLKQAQYLKELDEMKSNFLSIVSHDLKTPIAKIQAVAERLRRELQLPNGERSDWRELIDSIENSNNELKHYITSILNLSRIESQKVILNKRSNDINELIRQALKRLRTVASQKQITVVEELEPLFSIECDEDLIRQVLTNLIDNAIKYSPQGSKVIVRSSEEEGFVRIEIEDFGPGIPKDQLPLMFRKFSRFLRPMREQVKGTGLGLYLSKYFIELHGGTIRVKSVEGQGTTFTFTLPLHGEEGEAILG